MGSQGGDALKYLACGTNVGRAIEVTVANMGICHVCGDAVTPAAAPRLSSSEFPCAPVGTFFDTPGLPPVITD